MKWRFITLFLLATGIASADERILSYHSDILIRADGWIEVTETIRVRAEGNQIRRGIYRDYPTQYEDRFVQIDSCSPVSIPMPIGTMLVACSAFLRTMMSSTGT